MNQASYFCAALYQKLRDKKPDGIPYFNFRMGLITLLLFTYAEIAIELKAYNGTMLFPDSFPVVLLIYGPIAYIIFYIITLIFPREKLEDINITNKAKNLCYYIFFSYLYFSIGIIIYLSILSTKH